MKIVSEKIKTAGICLIAALLLILSACSTAESSKESGAANQTPDVSVRQKSSQILQEDVMNIVITAGSHQIKAALYDNKAARDLYDSLPATYSMMNLYDREMCYRMGNGSLPTDEAADTGYSIGDISYWPPAGSLVILYQQNGEVFEQQPIGHTDDDLSFFENMGDVDITWEKDE